MNVSRVIIFGGSGFVGQALSKAALSKHDQVISISRSGKPRQDESWMNQVKWISADVFQPAEWEEIIQPKDHIIDAIGILFEKKTKGVTYEKVHYQAAKQIAEVAKKKGVHSVVYLSATIGLPFFPAYLQQKQRAEQVILENIPSAIIVKPNLMYGPQRKGTIQLAKVILAVKKIPFIPYSLKRITPEKVEVVAKEVIQLLHDSI